MDFIEPMKLATLNDFKDDYCSTILKAGSSRATNVEIALAKE